MFLLSVVLFGLRKFMSFMEGHGNAVCQSKGLHGEWKAMSSSRQTRLWREYSSIPVTVAYVTSMRASYMRPTRAIGMIAAPFFPAPLP